jgi:hypothetical protein
VAWALHDRGQEESVMAQSASSSPFGRAGRHRADEIGVHERAWWESAWPLLVLLAVLVLGLLAFWAFGRSRVSAPAVGTGTTPERPYAAAPGADMDCRSSTIDFEQDGSALDKDDYDEITSIAECLKRNPKQSVRLEGRADPRETLAGHTTLAQERAEGVAEELRSLGVDPGQVSTMASATTCSEADDACFEQDRSVTIIVTP